VSGGLELAIWCDIRIVATDAVFGVFCRRFGVPLIDGGTVRLPRLIGQSRWGVMSCDVMTLNIIYDVRFYVVWCHVVCCSEVLCGVI
jgi:enoyl-CoA hydratase/carnithine racemase